MITLTFLQLFGFIQALPEQATAAARQKGQKIQEANAMLVFLDPKNI